MENRKNDADHVAIAAAQAAMEAIQAAEHPRCLFCGRENPIGFKLDFRVEKPGEVRAAFPCTAHFQSYFETLHGGVTSALLDAAMTNALFSLGIVAVTGELTVRFLHPIALDAQAEVAACVRQASKPLYRLEAEVSQSGKVVARGKAKFVDREWAANEAGGGAAAWAYERGW